MYASELGLKMSATGGKLAAASAMFCSRIKSVGKSIHLCTFAASDKSFKDLVAGMLFTLQGLVR